METIIKIIGTVIIWIPALWLTCLLWGSQIDAKKSIINVLHVGVPKLPTVIATREAKSVYQNGEKVGDIRGQVSEGSEIIFEKIINTQNLQLDQPFEFGRYRLIVLSIANQIGLNSVISDKGGAIEQAVIEGVRCRIIK
ncbi:MAG: hypothetical protein SFW62_06495 [Alphaproteobacteria bacterium]|nr:hypothetical protein [Alphaproteobacteria bacterium]